jgi:hypothetical protein
MAEGFKIPVVHIQQPFGTAVAICVIHGAHPSGTPDRNATLRKNFSRHACETNHEQAYYMFHKIKFYMINYFSFLIY